MDPFHHIWLSLVLSWQLGQSSQKTQFLTDCAARHYIFYLFVHVEQLTCSQAVSMLLSMPQCPSWICDSTSLRTAGGMTIASHIKMRPSVTHSSSVTGQYSRTSFWQLCFCFGQPPCIVSTRLAMKLLFAVSSRNSSSYLSFTGRRAIAWWTHSTCSSSSLSVLGRCALERVSAVYNSFPGL